MGLCCSCPCWYAMTLGKPVDFSPPAPHYWKGSHLPDPSALPLVLPAASRPSWSQWDMAQPRCKAQCDHAGTVDYEPVLQESPITHQSSHLDSTFWFMLVSILIIGQWQDEVFEDHKNDTKRTMGKTELKMQIWCLKPWDGIRSTIWRSSILCSWAC